MSQPHLTHPLTGEPIVPLGHRRNGDPIWPVIGAADTDPAPPADPDPPTDPDGDPDPPGTDDLADAGKKALDAMKGERNAARRDARAATKRIADLEAELGRLRGAPPQGDPAPPADPETIRRDAERTATEKANGRILRAEVRAAAAGRLHDPADALAYLELSDFDVADDGTVDGKAIAEAIDELLERKPYLAKKATPDPKPTSFDSGPRGGGAAATSAAKAAAMLASRGIPLPATTPPADTTTR